MLLNSVEGTRSEVKRRPHKQLHINPVYRRSWPMGPNSPMKLKVRISLRYRNKVQTPQGIIYNISVAAKVFISLKSVSQFKIITILFNQI